ncbi:MAG: helix-hairpin-helix domain-containing protein, partial [Kaistella sp.]
KAKIAYQPFDPNLTNLEGWRKLGFSEKQAQVIINYRDRNLKGSFKSLDDIERCFVISEEKFAEMKPYIVLNPENFKTSAPQKNYTSNVTASKNTMTEDVKTDFSKVDLNQITYKQLLEFGFDEKSAAMMLGFRKKLGGFVNRQQIIETYDIDKNLAQKLVSVAILDDSRITKYTLVDAPEEWLKSHPYFKYSADKIIYYRITDPNEKKIWKFIKVKPEYEARMKLYLK